jgi:cell division septation protein DedD
MPNAPGGDFQTKELPLVTPAAGVPQGGVVGMDASHPAAPVAASSSAHPAAALQPAPNASASGAAAAPIAVNLPTTTAQATAAPTTAPATAATSPPVPAANTGGRYVVSLGTYSNAANAQSLVASLKAAQLPAYAETMTVAGVPATRVRIGPYSQRGDAEAARLKSQQVRTDMPANVIALDAAVPAPDVAAAPNKPVSATVAPAAKPTAPTTAPAVKPTTPSVPTTAAATPAAAPVPASTKHAIACGNRPRLRGATRRIPFPG